MIKTDDNRSPSCSGDSNEEKETLVESYTNRRDFREEPNIDCSVGRHKLKDTSNLNAINTNPQLSSHRG